MSNEIHIVGGGASGLMAGISAAEFGAHVVIHEKMDRPGRKLSITGNGRCNLTTVDAAAAAAAAFGPNGRFLRSAFSRFFSAELIELFVGFGVPIVKEEGRGYFPKSGRAADITAALIYRAKELGVETLAGSSASMIDIEDGRVAGLKTGKRSFAADRVLLATGGASYPGTGSTGDGYRIAEALGHSIVPPLPAVVPLLLDGRLHSELAPLSFVNVRAVLQLDGKNLLETRGDILFTPWGVTGPAALALSKLAAANAGKGELSLAVNFEPDMSQADLDKMLVGIFSSGGPRTAENVLGDIMPKRAAAAFARGAKVREFRNSSNVTSEERANLVKLMSDCRLTVKGTRPLAEAMVTAGGVSLMEVNPKTMESKIIRGLYISGELLDLDAGSGGYNLQAAFSTGFVAGRSMAAEQRG